MAMIGRRFFFYPLPIYYEDEFERGYGAADYSEDLAFRFGRVRMCEGEEDLSSDEEGESLAYTKTVEEDENLHGKSYARWAIQRKYVVAVKQWFREENSLQKDLASRYLSKEVHKLGLLIKMIILYRYKQQMLREFRDDDLLDDTEEEGESDNDNFDYF